MLLGVDVLLGLLSSFSPRIGHNYRHVFLAGMDGNFIIFHRCHRFIDQLFFFFFQTLRRFLWNGTSVHFSDDLDATDFLGCLIVIDVNIFQRAMTIALLLFIYFWSAVLLSVCDLSILGLF